jgi:hypothetical protein
MVKIGRRYATFVLLLTLVLCAAKCNDQDSGITKALKATDDLRAGIDAAITLTTKLAEDKHITPQQEKQINLLLLGVNSSVKIFYLEVISAKNAGEWNPTVKSRLAASFANVNTELQRLRDAGVFNSSDPESKKQIEIVFQSINIASQLITGLLQ